MLVYTYNKNNFLIDLPGFEESVPSLNIRHFKVGNVFMMFYFENSILFLEI